MREQDVFVLADTTLKGVVDQITDEQWSMVMPSSFATRSHEGDRWRPSVRGASPHFA